jgi:glycosyltransferase involved in cell wall biosynthesis
MLSAMEEHGLMPDLVWACFGRSLGRTAKKIYDVYSIPYIVSEFEARLLTEKIKKSEMRDLTKVYGNAAARIARNEPFARALERRTGYNFSVVPQAVCIEETKRASHSDFRFVSVGALSVDKGMDVVLRAFSRIKKIRRDTTLTIVGSGDEYNNLVRQTQALGITDSVIFVRPSGGASIKNILKDCDCFVLASRKELFGVVYLIAMSVGLPCVTTDCFAPRQIIPPYCGVVCDVDDTRGIEEGMLAVMRNPSRYSEERIKKYMIEKFSTEAVSDKIRGILSKIFI